MRAIRFANTVCAFCLAITSPLLIATDTSAVQQEALDSLPDSQKPSLHADINFKELRTHELGGFLMATDWVGRLVDRFDYGEWTGDDLVEKLDRVVIFDRAQTAGSERPEFLIRYEFSDAESLEFFLDEFVGRETIDDQSANRDSGSDDWTTIDLEEIYRVRFNETMVELGLKSYFLQPRDKLVSESVSSQFAALGDVPFRLAMDRRVIEAHFQVDVSEDEARELALSTLFGRLHEQGGPDSPLIQMFLLRSVAKIQTVGLALAPDEDSVIQLSVCSSGDHEFEELTSTVGTLVQFFRFALEVASIEASASEEESKQLASQLRDGIRISTNRSNSEILVTVRKSIDPVDKIGRILSTGRILARERMDANRMKVVGIAVHNYLDIHKRLPFAHRPTAETSEHLSWRVHILPYMERYYTWDRLERSKAWDSEQNSELLEPLRGDFRLSDQSLISFVQPERIPLNEQGIRDGLSNTIMAIGDPTADDDHWAKPQDISIDEAVALLKSLESGESILVLFYDAHIGRIHSVEGLTDEEIRSLFDPDDGMQIPAHIFD